MRILRLYRNLDFNLGGGKPDKGEEDLEDQLTEEQKKELERIAEEAKKSEENKGKTPEQIAAEEEAKKKAQEAQEEERKQKEGESDEDYQARIKALDEGGEDDTIIGEFISEFGAVEGAEELADDLDGLKEYFRKVTPSIKKEGADELLNKYPVLNALHRHLEEGKSLDTFMKRQQAVDYSKVKVDDKTDASILETYITQNLKELRVDEETIKIVLEGVKDKDMLLPKAKESLKALNERQEASFKAQEEHEKKLRLKEIEDARQEEETIKGIITKGTINGAVISKEDKQALQDFIFKPIKDGKTARELALEKLSYEENLYIDLLIMKGKLKSTSPSTKKSASLRELKDKSKVDPNLNNSRGGGKGAGNSIPSIQELLERT